MNAFEAPKFDKEVALSNEQQLLVSYLFAEENPSQVMTWIAVANYLPYYTPEGIHSMTFDINQKFAKVSFSGRIYFDVTRYNSRGMGIIYGDPEDPNVREELSRRLEAELKKEAIVQSDEDPSGWEHMQDVSFYFPVFRTDQYPNPKPAAVIVRTPEKRGVTFLTPDEITLLRFIVEENGYVDEETWKKQRDGLKKLSGGIEGINRAIKQVFPEETFVKGNIFPLGYAYHGDPKIRHTKLREAMKPQFNVNRLARSEIARVDSRFLSMPTGNHLQVTLVPLEDLQRFLAIPTMRVSERFPFALVITSDRAYSGTERLLDSSIFMEISESEASIIRMFRNRGELSLKNQGLTSKEQDAIRNGFSALLKRLTLFGYTFQDGTGIASRSQLTFPEPFVRPLRDE